MAAIAAILAGHALSGSETSSAVRKLVKATRGTRIAVEVGKMELSVLGSNINLMQQDPRRKSQSSDQLSDIYRHYPPHAPISQLEDIPRPQSNRSSAKYQNKSSSNLSL